MPLTQREQLTEADTSGILKTFQTKTFWPRCTTYLQQCCAYANDRRSAKPGDDWSVATPGVLGLGNSRVP